MHGACLQPQPEKSPGSQVSLSLRFLYGKNVDGMAFVIFGVQDGDKKISLAHSLQRVMVLPHPFKSLEGQPLPAETTPPSPPMRPSHLLAPPSPSFEPGPPILSSSPS